MAVSPETTGLHREIMKIFGEGQKPVHARWLCQLTTPDFTYTPMKLLSMDIERRYDETYSDTVMVELAVDDDIYNHRIYPHRHDLKATLTREPLSEVGEQTVDTQPIASMEFRAVLVSDASSVMEGDLPPSRSGLPGDIMILRLQLMDLTLEQIRFVTVGGIRRNTTPAAVLQQMLTEVSQSLPVDSETGIVGVDMVAPDNTTVQEHVIIPHATPLVELPVLLQEKYGIYSSGLGFYLQDGIWYVYPELKTNRFGETPRGLTIINVPSTRYPQVERTYRTTSNQVIILATGEVIHGDQSDRLQQNQGNGVRFTDSRKVMEGFGSTQNNKTQLQRGQNNSEYVAWQRGSGLNHTPVSPERFSANPYAQASRLARRKGAVIQVKWENSEWGLLYPGMPVRFMYYEGDAIHEAEGVLLQAHHFVHSSEAGLVKGRHLTNSALTVFINNDTQWEVDELPA